VVRQAGGEIGPIGPLRSHSPSNRRDRLPSHTKIRLIARFTDATEQASEASRYG
jgi:hypothetical protein